MDIAVVSQEKEVLFKQQIFIALHEWSVIEVEIGSSVMFDVF